LSALPPVHVEYNYILEGTIPPPLANLPPRGSLLAARKVNLAASSCKLHMTFNRPSANFQQIFSFGS
jgi:hypothetical protein